MTALLTAELRFEQDVVLARQRARQVAELLGFDAQDQIRIATAVSEIARNAFAYAGGGKVEFVVDAVAPGRLDIRISDHGKGIADIPAILRGQYRSPTGTGLGILGAKRLVDHFDIRSQTPGGTTVALSKTRPTGAPELSNDALQHIVKELSRSRPDNPFQEMQQQNQDLIRALEELKRREAELVKLNVELEETNRGVVALYSELDEKAEQLRKSSEAKTRFLSHVSHEVRTPINAILKLSELLSPTNGTPVETQTKTLSYIRKSSLQLSELVNDLLDLAKVEAGRVEVHAKPLQLAELLGALRGVFRPQLTNDQVSLVFDEVTDLTELVTDEAKLSQILRNLLSNAVKFTERGEIRVSARLVDDELEIEVRDTGVGIAPADQDRLFQEFSQIENALQNKSKGTGLGLAISKGLAELLGGSLGVESELGKGSTFRLRIPRLYEAPSTKAARQSQNRKVLIVDDDEIARFLLRGSLPIERFSVLEASDGEAALSLARAERPAVVFLDLMMPGMSGHEVLDRLWAQTETRSIPVIIHTMQRLSPDEQNELAAKAVAIVPKDASREAAKNYVTAALRRAGLD